MTPLALPIRTRRLTITAFGEDMAEALHLNSLDEDNRRFVSDEVFETVEKAREAITSFLSFYARYDAPLVYPIFLDDETQIGYVQACPLSGGWEVGYHIAKPYTGNGYASEALAAFLPPIMARLGVAHVAGICLADNIASRRVLEKCGFILAYDGIGPYQGRKCHICRYVYPDDTLDERVLRQALEREGVPIEAHFAPVIDSTNTWLKSLSAQGASARSIAVAAEQTGGRGRMGRRFYAGSGGLYLSLLLRPMKVAPALGLVTLRAAAAAREAVERLGDVSPGIKWPNDLMLNGRKLCGILAEAAAEGGRLSTLVIGWGVNLWQSRADFPEDLRDIATSVLAEGGRRVGRAALAARILREFDRAMALPADAFLAEYRRYMLHDVVNIPQGNGALRAVPLDVDESGRLLARGEEGMMHCVTAQL